MRSHYAHVRISRLIFLLLALLLAPALVHAQAPEQEEAFVYGINATVPGAVYGSFAPPAVGDIYLIADQTSVISPRRTRIYFWPITNEYRAAWSQLNETVDGVLEIVQNGQLIESINSQPYTIHFTTEAGPGRPQLYVGNEALLANQQFEAMQAAYQQAATQYEQDREEWLAAAREAQAAGQEPTQPAPEPPPGFNLFSTGLNEGFPINLAPGEYLIRTRQANGEIVPGSERTLHVFEPRRTAVGYEVIPERRWTFPEQVDDLSDAILGESDSVVYLRPRVAREYPALAYERLQNPQYAGDAEGAEWVWIGDETDTTLDEGLLEIVNNGEVVDRIVEEAYYVRQVVGRELGYEIVRYSPDTPDVTPRVDFAGYRLPLSDEMNEFEIRLRSLSDELFVGSSRQVRVSPPVRLPVLLLIALLPLLVGALLLMWRRRQTRLVRTTVTD
jgi:hypothetical protein